MKKIIFFIFTFEFIHTIHHYDKAICLLRILFKEMKKNSDEKRQYNSLIKNDIYMKKMIEELFKDISNDDSL